MTISQLASSIQVAGNSIQTAFSFPFIGASTSDITVSSVASSGTITLLSPTAYSVTLNAAATNQIWGVGGQVIYPLSGSPLATGNSLLISRVLPFSQQVTTQNQGNYYAQVTEQALDTLEMQIQQLAGRTTQFRGIWITGTLYNAGDIVQDGSHGNSTNNYYICAIPNTAGTWSTDLAAGDWTISALAAVPTGQLTLTGDVTGSGTTPIATTLATVNSSVGSFTNSNITVDAKGRITSAASGGAAGGTVTSVTFTGDGTVLSSTPSAAVTTTGTVTGTLLSQAKNTVLAGPTTGSNAAPTFRALVGADLPMTPITNSLNADVSLTSTASYFDGPSIAQGTSGTWFVSGTITLTDTSASAEFVTKLWDGTTVIAATVSSPNNTNFIVGVALSGYIASPAGNLKISVRNVNTTSGKLAFNTSGFSKDCTITAIRIG